MPIPRFTYAPAGISAATRMAMTSRPSRSLASSIGHPRILVPGHDDDPIYVDPGCHDQLGVELSCFHELVYLGDRYPGGCRHQRIEVAAGVPVHEVPLRVGPMGANE